MGGSRPIALAVWESALWHILGERRGSFMYKRSDRVSKLLQEEISDIIMNKLKDPRIGFATVMRVELSEDLAYLKVYISVYGEEEEKRRTIEGLESAKGFIKGEIGKRVRIKKVPEISFFLDDSLSEAFRLMEIMKDLGKG
jgi:ribosome-binding factor A